MADTRLVQTLEFYPKTRSFWIFLSNIQPMFDWRRRIREWKLSFTLLDGLFGINCFFGNTHRYLMKIPLDALAVALLREYPTRGILSSAGVV
jgi:hypothetical protein